MDFKKKFKEVAEDNYHWHHVDMKIEIIDKIIKELDNGSLHGTWNLYGAEASTAEDIVEEALLYYKQHFLNDVKIIRRMKKENDKSTGTF